MKFIYNSVVAALLVGSAHAAKAEIRERKMTQAHHTPHTAHTDPDLTVRVSRHSDASNGKSWLIFSIIQFFSFDIF